jgi:hypothetical protein
MRQSNLIIMFDYFAPFFIRAIFIPNLLNSHLTKVKDVRTPIYEKYHLAREEGSRGLISLGLPFMKFGPIVALDY